MVLLLEPDFTKAWLMMGEDYENLENWEKSLECYNKVLELNPENKKVLLILIHNIIIQLGTYKNYKNK